MANNDNKAAADAPKKRKSPGPLPQRVTAQLENDEEIIAAAADELDNDSDLATALATHFIDAEGTIPINPTSLAALGLQAEDTRATGEAVTTGKANFHVVTAAETAQRKVAVAAIRSVQSRAKEKHEEKKLGQKMGGKMKI